MPKLEAYHRDLPYSYALGIFPAMECLRAWPAACRRLLVEEQGSSGEGLAKLIVACEAQGVRVENAHRALARIAHKENCYAAMVFGKQEGVLDEAQPHVVLHRPADAGNLGTILRTCLGFGVRHIAIVGQAADVYDPHVVRASMGALFYLQVQRFVDIDAYLQAFPGHALYPFMLTASSPLAEAVTALRRPYALLFGNEATGLPEEFSALGQSVRIPQTPWVDSLNLAAAVAVGVYTFREAEGMLDGQHP